MYTFSGALPISSGAFGDDTSSTIVRSVSCYGNEARVLNCSYSTDDPGICSEHSAAVICQGEKNCVLEHRQDLWCNVVSLYVCTDMATGISPCNDGEIRLIGGSTPNQGKLEVCMNSAWGSVCDSVGVFTRDEAKIACRQLGILQGRYGD